MYEMQFWKWEVFKKDKKKKNPHIYKSELYLS